MVRATPAVLFVLLVAAVTPARAQQGQDRSQARPKTTAEMLRVMWAGGGAGDAAKGPVKLVTFPLRLEDIGTIRPMGLMVSGHVTPSDHLYIIPKEPQENDKPLDVLAVADGHIVMIQWRPNGNPDPTVHARAVDLKVIVRHSADCWSYVDHVDSLEEPLLKQVGHPLQPGQPFLVGIPVKGGQVIGKVRQSFDFALVDAGKARKGFIVPEQFLARDPWKPHTVDPFDYLDEPLRGELLKLNPRTAEPRGGRIDYDADGALIGNWYKRDTGGYAGLNRRLDYWVAHLSIVYHYIDPTQIIISLGDAEGRARQFQVRGNRPDPAKVTAADGVVACELIIPRISDQSGRPYANAPERYYGVLMVQVLEGRTLRVELFPGKSRDEAKGFTERVATFER